MAQIVETYCEDDSNEAVAATPDLITHVEVHKMTVHDGHRLEAVSKGVEWPVSMWFQEGC